MNDLVILPAFPQPAFPAVFQSSPAGERRFWELFTVNIHNPQTRRAVVAANSVTILHARTG